MYQSPWIPRFALHWSLLACLAACQGGVPGSAGPGSAGAGSGSAGPGGPFSSSFAPFDPDVDGGDTTPHALGDIGVGEERLGSDKRWSFAYAAFTAGPSTYHRCTKLIDGCRAQLVPHCKESTAPSGCNGDDLCEFDEACAAYCKPTPHCSPGCSIYQRCVFAQGAPVCQLIEELGAGTLSFTGTSPPLMLDPPYMYLDSSGSVVLVPDNSIHVTATGATAAGFDAFDVSFTSTSIIHGKLDQLPRLLVFGTGPLTLSWPAGTDKVTVSLSGDGGDVTCGASDAAGRVDIPRTLIDYLRDPNTGDGSLPPTGELSIGIRRERVTLDKNQRTHGPYTTGTLPSVGWLQLTTFSSEIARYKSCGENLSYCDVSDCFDLRNDPNNCGACGNRCDASQYCASGVCT